MLMTHMHKHMVTKMSRVGFFPRGSFADYTFTSQINHKLTFNTQNPNQLKSPHSAKTIAMNEINVSLK